MVNERVGFEIPAWVADRLREELPPRFTGSIQMNCFEGGVGNITMTWSRKAPNSGDNVKKMT